MVNLYDFKLCKARQNDDDVPVIIMLLILDFH